MKEPFKFCLGPFEIQMVGAPDPQQKMSTKSPTCSSLSNGQQGDQTCPIALLQLLLNVGVVACEARSLAQDMAFISMFEKITLKDTRSAYEKLVCCEVSISVAQHKKAMTTVH